MGEQIVCFVCFVYLRIGGLLFFSLVCRNTGTLFTAVEGIRSAHALRALRRSSARPALALAFKPKTIFKDSRMGYCLQFPGADPTIVRNSQIERAALQKGIAPIPIGLYFSSDSILVFLALIWIGFVVFLTSKVSLFESLLRKFPSILTLGVFSDQPAPESLREKYAKWTFVFETSGGKIGSAVMSLRDPGYSATATCVVGCALTVVRERSKLVSGVVTTATAFQNTNLLSHLQTRGVGFQILK